MIRALDKGPEAKHILDAVIDASAAMQNLREGINAYRARFLKEVRERQRNTLLSVCLEYLERWVGGPGRGEAGLWCGGWSRRGREGGGVVSGKRRLGRRKGRRPLCPALSMHPLPSLRTNP